MTNQTNENSGNIPDWTIRDVVNVIFRHKQVCTIFFCAVFLLVAVITFLMPKTYQSTAQLMLRLGRENASLDPMVSLGPSLNISDSRENELNSALEMIRSRELAEKVVDTIGISRILNQSQTGLRNTENDSFQIREAAIQSVIRNIRAETVKKTNIINISFKSSNPNTAQDVVSVLITFYQIKHMALYRPAGSYQFFTTQTDTLKAQLSANQDSLLNLKNTTGIAGINEQRNNILSRINALQLEMDQVKANIASSLAKISSLNATLANMPQIIAGQKIGGTTASSSDLLRNKLNDLRLKRQEMLTKYSENSRPVVDLQTQISETQSLLDREDFDNRRSNAVNEVQMELIAEQSNMAALRGKVSSLSNMLANANDELKKFNENSIGLSRLELQQQNYERNYSKYNENLEQARIDHALKAGNLSNVGIVQAATLPTKPIKPQKKYNLLLGFFFGLFGGFAIAFFLEFLDHTIKSREEIEALLKLPALGILPKLDTINGKPWIVPSQAIETFDIIRGMIHAPSPQGVPQVLAVTSCYPGEGTTTVSTYLAASLVSHLDSTRVLMIDCNVKHPNLHSVFNVEQAPGFVDYVSVQYPMQSIVPLVQNKTPGIDIIPAGSQTDQSLRIAQSKRFVELLSFWKTQYGFIVIDVPNVSESSLSIELSSLIDGLVLVIESERVKREVVMQSLSKLTRAGTAVLGVVLNKRKFYMPSWIYKKL